jgi:hypothetical protein
LKGAVTKWRNEVIGNSLKSLNFLSLEGKALKRPGMCVLCEVLRFQLNSLALTFGENVLKNPLVNGTGTESFDLGGMIVSQVDAV